MENQKYISQRIIRCNVFIAKSHYYPDTIFSIQVLCLTSRTRHAPKTYMTGKVSQVFQGRTRHAPCSIA